MPYSKVLADRIRSRLPNEDGTSEREMFGGIGFMILGNMACGVIGDDLMVRVGPDQYEQSLALPHVRPFEMTGRPMKGWVLVAAEGLKDDNTFSQWVDRGIEFAGSLPAK